MHINPFISWNKPIERSILKDKEREGAGAKLEVVTLQGTTKKYMVLANGKRVLISESKSKAPSQQGTIANQHKQDNTAEVMAFLNHLMGIGSSNIEVSLLNHTQSGKREAE